MNKQIAAIATAIICFGSIAVSLAGGYASFLPLVVLLGLGVYFIIIALKS